MLWLKRDMWKASISIAGLLLFLVIMMWIPMSANASGVMSAFATPGTVLSTPTVDPTMTALQKEQLTLQNDKLRNDNVWAWLSPVSTILGPLATFGTILVGILVARNNLLQWSKNRQDEEKRRAEDQRIDREKRDEERFQKVVEGLGSKDIEPRVGSAVALRTFLRPGYEQFYRQTFDLACAYLLLRKAAPNADRNVPVALDPLNEALIIVFRESFPRVRDSFSEEERSRYPPPYFNTTGIQLDNAYLSRADLKQVWMPRASLRKAHLHGADLSGAVLWGSWLNNADLRETRLSGAGLRGVNLSGAILSEADLSSAVLWGAKLNNADLRKARLSGADLRGANPEDAHTLRQTDLRGVKGLTKEQLEACKAKGAIIDDDRATDSTQPTAVLLTQRSAAQTPSAGQIQASKLPANTGESTNFRSTE